MMEKHVILGTAGHIDHGKTALVKALTGVDTDRLKVEKERGITTELGFTFLDLPSGIRLGIIDVPGHERFVRHMVAGVWGIDLVALIIAADEGVMPQTREHLDICRLLEVKKGLIVLTKVDLVDEDLLGLVKEEVTDIVRNTFLKDAPIRPVSSVTGKGIPELISELDRLSQEVEGRSTEGVFRLPIDRVFVMKGFGTVVTGTVVSGVLSIGDLVQILPSGLEAKVRGLQVYNQPVEKALAGQRAAVNLQGIETSDVKRGDVVTHSHTLDPSATLDVYIEYLRSAERPLRNRTKQRFHIGTNLTSASIFLLDREELAPGESTFAQLRLEAPVVALPRDRFVIRGSGVIQTLGGGVVLDVHPPRHRRRASSAIEELTVLKDGSQEETIRHHIRRFRHKGIALDDLLKRVATPPSEVRGVMEKMIGGGEVLLIDPERMKVIDIGFYHQLKEMALTELKEFHQRSPMKPGLSKEELRTKLPMDVDVRLFQILLSDLLRSKEVILDKDKLRLPTHQVSSMDEKGLIKRVEETLLRAGLQSPSPKELSDTWSETEEAIQAVFDHLVHEGVLVRIKGGIYIHRDAIGHLKEALIAYLKKNKDITTSQFKEMTNASRKYAIPLIEYFDQIKLTIRLGDKRVLRSSSEPG